MMRIFTLILVLLFTCTLWGCKKEENIQSKKATNISGLQAATMVATSLALNSYGLSGIKNDITQYVKNMGASNGKGCGVEDAFSVARQDLGATNINYNYAIGYHYTLNCDGTVKDNLSATTLYNGSFDAATLSAVHSSTSVINVSNLGETATNFNLKGTYEEVGTFQTIDETQLAGSNGIYINIIDLLVDKTTKAILGGSVSVSVSGTVKSNKNVFDYTGTIIFNDANTATLTLADTKYKINLTTADVIAL